MCPWNPNIPQSTDKISISQGDILNDYVELNTYLPVNHVAFGDPNEGKHKFAQFPAQRIDPTTDENTVALFCKQTTMPVAGSLATLTLKKSTLIPGFQTWEFGQGLIVPGNLVGWARLPSGLLMKWERAAITAAGAGTGNLNYNFSFQANETIPAFFNGSVPLFMMVTAVNNQNPQSIGATISVVPINNLRYTIKVSTKNANSSWNAFNVFVLAFGDG